MHHLKDSNLRDLSGGEFQRVFVSHIHAIAKKPEFLVLDECTGCDVCVVKCALDSLRKYLKI